MSEYLKDAADIAAEGGALQRNVLPVARPEQFGAVGDGVTDDHVALQTAYLTGRRVEHRTGAIYASSQPIYVMGGRQTARFNNCLMRALWGGVGDDANWGVGFFQMNPATPLSTDFRMFDGDFEGNCTPADFRYAGYATGVGLKLYMRKIRLQTQDSNRRLGTTLVKIDQADFVKIENCEAINCDGGMIIGAAVGSGRRNCTQVTISRTYIAQVNFGSILQGIDKLKFDSNDVQYCNAGHLWLGDNNRHDCFHPHVEGLAVAGYTVASATIPPAAAGKAFYFADNQRNKDITLYKPSVIDIGTGPGAAITAIYVGDCTDSDIQYVEVIRPELPEALATSVGYVPLQWFGNGHWEGGFQQYSTAPVLGANGKHFISNFIRDLRAPKSPNLLKGNTVMSLFATVAGNTTVPTFTEVGFADTTHFGHRIDFNDSVYMVADIINLPRGFITMEFSGYRLGGGVLAVCQRNGSGFTDLMRRQINDIPQTVSGGATINPTKRRWFTFWNPVANDGVRIGFVNQSVGTAGVDRLYIEAGSLAVYRGFAQDAPPQSPVETMLATPTASTLWRNHGKPVRVRVSNSQDADYSCVNDASNTSAWRQRLMANTGNVTGVVSGFAHFVATASKQVTNTTTPTSLVPTGGVGSVTIPAAGLTVGRAYRLAMAGTFGSDAVPGNLTVAVKLNAVTVVAQTITNLLAAQASEAGSWSLDLDFACRTVGASGSIQPTGFLRYNTAVGILAALPVNNGGASVTIDTTVAQVLDVTVTWATADADNIIITKTMVFEAVN